MARLARLAHDDDGRRIGLYDPAAAEALRAVP
jgi:hypothetical protein